MGAEESILPCNKKKQEKKPILIPTAQREYDHECQNLFIKYKNNFKKRNISPYLGTTRKKKKKNTSMVAEVDVIGLIAESMKKLTNQALSLNYHTV